MGSPVKEVESKLKNFDLNNNINAPTQNETEEVLKVVFNKGAVVEVNKEKILQKSEYFRAITKPSFNDCTKGYYEVNFEAGDDALKYIVSYIDDNDIKLNNAIVLGVYGLANYLRIDGLDKKCLDYFIYNLNRNALDDQLNIMKSEPALYENFEKIALKFMESKRTRFSGLYVLEGNLMTMMNKNGDDHYNKCVDFKSHIDFKDYTDYRLQHHFLNSLIISASCRRIYRYFLLQCDLISGEISDVEVDYSGETRFCSDEKHLFILNPIIDEQKNRKVSLSTLGKESGSDVITVFKTKIFDLSCRKTKYDLSKIQIHFAVCDGGKLFIFYKRCDDCQGGSCEYTNGYCICENEPLNTVYILTISTETLDVLSNLRLTESLQFDEEKSAKQYKTQNFYAIYHHNKTHKLFVQTFDSYNRAMVIDLKSQCFYFIENFMSDRFCIVKIEPNYDTVYGIVIKDNCQLLSVREFHYSNDKLVDTGEVCKLYDDEISICFV